MLKRLALAVAIAVSAGLIPRTSANIIIGQPADLARGNCFPFGCDYDGLYQQVYTSSAFSGPISIVSLEFFNTERDFGATALGSAIWTISLSTTNADWNSLSSSFASNIGGDDTVVFSGDLAQPWAFGKTLHIDLATAFFYDPALGNLLLNVDVSSPLRPDAIISFDSNGYNNDGFNGNTIMGRVWDVSGNVNSGYGLVTGFGTDQPVRVPEPSALALIGVALFSLLVLARCRVGA